MVAELLTLVNIGYVHLDYRRTERAYAVLQGDARVGVGTGVEHYAAAREASLLHLVDEFAFDVALIITYLDVGICGTKRLQIVVERAAAIYSGFARAEQIKIRAIDDLYFHNVGFW